MKVVFVLVMVVVIVVVHVVGFGQVVFLFLGARAPLQLLHVKIKKKNTKKFQNINYLLYLANCFRSALRYTSMQVCKYANFQELLPTIPRMITH